MDQFNDTDKTSDIEDTSSMDNLSDTTDDFYDSLSETENIDEEVDENTEINDKCIYKYVEESESDEEVDIEDLFDDDDYAIDKAYVPKEKRITKPYLTKYERVRLLSVRTKQLAAGAKPLIKNAGDLSSKQIAELEIKNNAIPLIIDRPLPCGLIERWYISELIH